MGVFAFGGGTAGGVLLGELMCKLSGGKINPLIGSAGVSAVPMAARVSQKVGQAENPEQLPADARHGPERGRRYRLCGCGGRVHLDVRLTDLRSVSLPPKFAESEGLCTRERSCA